MNTGALSLAKAFSPTLVRATVARRNGECCLVALGPIRQGERVLAIDGPLVNKPCRYSIQVGAGLHVGPPPGLTRDDASPRYYWRFLNHSCDPNSALVGREIVALRTIAEGEEVTFNYNTTEYDMASPFRCHCGHCGGRLIRGFRHLSAAEQHRLTAMLADHLRHLMTPWLNGEVCPSNAAVHGHQ
jgi:hypothetical protein